MSSSITVAFNLIFPNSIPNLRQKLSSSKGVRKHPGADIDQYVSMNTNNLIHVKSI